MRPIHPAAQTHPWTLRLFVDVDPAGNPIGGGAIHFEAGHERATIWFDVPGPFDELGEALGNVVEAYLAFVGEQPTLF